MNTPPPPSTSPIPTPYKIAVLVYVWNDASQLLLLHRKRPPNQGLYSPIGGKLEQSSGESPWSCALREIHEEIAIQLTLDDIRLLGLVSERAYNGHASGAPPSHPAAHWLMFCFEVTRPLNFPARDIDEGRLEWIDPARIPSLSIPKTDREVIWPLIQKHSLINHAPHHSYFSVHIDCTNADDFIITHEHPRPPLPAGH